MPTKTAIIGIMKVPNTDCLDFHLKEETKKHLKLGRRLLKIEGITGNDPDGFPICMNHNGQYDFSLIKAALFSWKQLLPIVKREIRKYFKEKNRPVRFFEMKRSR